MEIVTEKMLKALGSSNLNLSFLLISRAFLKLLCSLLLC